MKINTTFKAVEGHSDDNAQFTELKAEIQAALTQIETFKTENGQWLSDENLSKMGYIETMLKAEFAAIEAYGVGGVPGQGGAGGEEDWVPKALEPGWNGAVQIDPDNDSDRDLLSDDPDRYGAYAGTINILSSGNPTKPGKIAFQMADGMDAVYAESRGRDIIVTAVYRDETRRSWVIKDGTVRPEPIVISGRGLTYGVTIDASKVIRINDGTYPQEAYETQRFYIWGTDLSDTIKGSQGRDKIVGGLGADDINGGAGDDMIWGDEYEPVAGAANPNGGNDTLRGGDGIDIIYGGGGFDTYYKSDKGERITEAERMSDDTPDALPDNSFIIHSNEWEVTNKTESGMIVVENTKAKGGWIGFNQMPDGYNMAYADRVDNSLVITYVGDEGSFKVKVVDFFNRFGDDPKESVVRLTFNASADNDIIDFSRILINDATAGGAGQVIAIKGGDGEDIILGPRNALIADGVDMGNILKSQGDGKRNMSRYFGTDGIFAAPAGEKPYGDNNERNKFGGYLAENKGDHVLIRNAGTSQPTQPLYIHAPDGYEKGYITKDGSGNIVVVLVKPATGDRDADTLVIKIDKQTLPNVTWNDIIVRNKVGGATDKDVQWGQPINLTPIDTQLTDIFIDGEGGKDLIFTFDKDARDVKDEDGEDDVNEMEPETPPAR